MADLIDKLSNKKVKKEKEEEIIIEMDELKVITCPICGKMKANNTTNFYSNPNSDLFLGTKGTVIFCKSCIKKRLNKLGSNGVIKILRLLDKPYIPTTWAKQLDKYKKDLPKAFSTYLSAINLAGKNANSRTLTFDDGVTNSYS